MHNTMYYAQSMTRFEQFRFKWMFKAFAAFYSTPAATNYGLHWSRDLLRFLTVKQVINWPVDYVARFADQTCIDKLQQGQLMPSDIGHIGDEICIDNLNVTAIGNLAHIYCYSDFFDLVDMATISLETIKSMANGGHRVGMLV